MGITNISEQFSDVVDYAPGWMCADGNCEGQGKGEPWELSLKWAVLFISK